MFKNIKSVLPFKKQRLWFWVVLIVLFLFYPYIFADAVFSFHADTRIILVLLFLFFPLAMLLTPRKMPWPLTLSLAVMIIGGVAHFLHTGDKYYYHRIVTLLFSYSLLVIVYYKIGLKRFYTIYNKWILIMSIGCFIAMIVAFVGVPPLFEFVEKSDNRVMYSWLVSCTKAYSGPGSLTRMGGFFDEPGAMGYFACFAIAFNRLLIKDKRMEWMLLLFTLFTFSFGYILQAIVYVLCFIVFGNNEKRRLPLLVLLVVLVVGLYATKDTKYNEVYANSIGKVEALFSVDNMMTMESTSREILLEDSKRAFESSPIWGVGWNTKGYMGDNFYETLGKDGIIGFVYQYFPFFLLLFWGIIRRDYEIIAIVVFLFLSLFHRPLHAFPLNYFIYYSLPVVYYLKVRENNGESHKVTIKTIND